MTCNPPCTVTYIIRIFTSRNTNTRDMQAINNVVVGTVAREDFYDDVEFDTFKYLLRQNGITNPHCTILCSLKLFVKIENCLLPYILEYNKGIAGDKTKEGGERVFMKSGVTFHLYSIQPISNWNFVLIPGDIDITKPIQLATPQP